MTMTGIRESAQVRVIHASVDTPPVDLYLGENPLAYSLAFGTRTTYVPVTQGTYLLHAEGAGTRQTLALANSALLAGHQYTAIIGDALGSLHLTLLPDQSKPAPPGQSAFRLVDQAFHSGPLDVYMVPSGSTAGPGSAVAALNFGSAASYRLLAAGSYSLTVLPAGTPAGSASASLFTSPQMSFASGSVRTIVLLDRAQAERQSGAGTLQVIVNEDGEPSLN